jgi:transposase-like protein
MISFKGAHFRQDIILMGVRWYVAYPLSYRHVEELMEERGVSVDHATINRTAIEIRQIKYLNNMVEEDHRAVKRVTRSMLGFKAFEAAQRTLAGIELMQMIRKWQLESGAEQGITAANQFYSLAA